MCWTTTTGTGRSPGKADRKRLSASGPPVEQPTASSRNGPSRRARGAVLGAPGRTGRPAAPPRGNPPGDAAAARVDGAAAVAAAPPDEPTRAPGPDTTDRATVPTGPGVPVPPRGSRA